MPRLEIALLTLMLLGIVLGGWSMYWASFGREAGRVLWGRRLCVLALLDLGGCALVAACVHAEALAPLGLSAGLLVVAILWESPVSRPEEV